MQVVKKRRLVKSFQSNLLSNTILICIKFFISFQTVPNNFQLDLEQVSFNTFESSDGNFFLDNKDADLNYFDEINIPSKEKAHLNETDIKNLLYQTQRFENNSVLHVNIRGLKSNFENFSNLFNNNGSSFIIIYSTETWNSNSEITHGFVLI